LCLFLFLASGCGDDDGGTEPRIDPSHQQKWYPVGRDFSWTYVWFDSAGTPEDTATVVIQADSINGNTHRITKCWLLNDAGLCPFWETVSPESVTRQMLGVTYLVFEFPLTPGRRWTLIHEEGDTSDVRVETVVVGDCQMTLRTGLQVSEGIQMDLYEIRIPRGGGTTDTVRVSSTFLGADQGTVMWKDYYRGYTTELLGFSKPSARPR
jgi:hypothetical protein